MFILSNPKYEASSVKFVPCRFAVWKVLLPTGLIECILKPLFQGLNVLLNTCNIDTVEKYTEFADHVTCVAANNESAVPIVNRRCVAYIML